MIDISNALPAPALRPYVAWYSGYRQVGSVPGAHRGLPSPQLTLIFTLDEPIRMSAHPDPGQPPAEYDALLAGLHTRPALVTHTGRQSGIQLALNPLGARALLGLPAAELYARDLDACDVLGAVFVAELRERIRCAPTWAQRFRCVDELLLTRLRAANGLRPELRQAWLTLLDSGGAADVAGLARSVGWSSRHLSGRFRAEFGLGPKAFGRLVRFDRASGAIPRRLRAGDTLAEIAADHGYFDQSHLDREFRELAGCAPTTWLAEEFRNFQVGAGHPEPESVS